jgi:hypothetical protein
MEIRRVAPFNVALQQTELRTRAKGTHKRKEIQKSAKKIVLKTKEKPLARWSQNALWMEKSQRRFYA